MDEIEIMLDKPRHLVLNLNVVRDFEKATNKNFWELGVLTGTDSAALLWASLRQEEGAELLTPHDVGKMAPASRWKEIDEKLAALIAQAKPKVKGKKTSPLAKDRT